MNHPPAEFCNLFKCFPQALSELFKNKYIYLVATLLHIHTSYANLAYDSPFCQLTTHFRMQTVCNRFTWRMRNYVTPANGSGSENSRVSPCLLGLL